MEENKYGHKYEQVNVLVLPSHVDKVRAYGMLWRGESLVEFFENTKGLGDYALDDPIFDWLSERWQVRDVPSAAQLNLIATSEGSGAKLAAELEQEAMAVGVLKHKMAVLRQQLAKITNEGNASQAQEMSDLQNKVWFAQAEFFAYGTLLVGKYMVGKWQHDWA